MENEFNVNDVVNLAINGEISDLQKVFDSVVRDKIEYALELKRQEIGQNIGREED